MATNTQLKFYKVQTLPETLVVGAIYFEVTTQRICVAKTTTTYDAFGVGLKEAALLNGVLTITRYDGTKVEVDLNDIASATSVQNALNAINNKINIINGEGDGSIKKAVATEKERAEDAEAKIREDFAAADSQIRTDFAAVDTAIRDEMAADKSELQVKIDAKADAATTYSKTEVDNLVNVKANAADVYTKTETDAAIKVVSDALAQEVTNRTNAVTGLQDQIDDLVAGTVEVKHAEGDKYVEVSKADGSTTYTVSTKGIDDAISTAVGTETANRESAISTLQSEVDGIEGKVNTLIGDDEAKSVRAIAAEELAAQLIPETAGEALDTLQEIAAWIQSHPGDASAMNADIESLKTKVGEKAVSVQISDAISALSDEAKSSEDANLVKVTVSQADGNVTGVSLDDSKLDEALSSINGNIGANTAAHEANAAAIKVINETTIPGLESRLDGHDDDVERIDGVLATLATSEAMTALTNRVSANEAAITRLDGEQATQNQNISAADAKGAQGIADAAAALAEAQAKVASVTAGNDYVSVGGTATAPTVSVNVVGEIAEGNTGLVNGGAIFQELCWVEFA